ncbi:MAG: hypothetical protein N2Z63_01490 [Thiobacillaceae bacterium]|nr:hypothetical protein [Thiobacillaceae bacterium]
MSQPPRNLLTAAFPLFLLRELPFERFAFPRWQSWLALVLIGLLVGLDPGYRAGAPQLPLAAVMGANVLLVLLLTPLVVTLLRVWLKRGGRWDGQGELFNLLVASWLLPDVLGAGLTALGVPALLTVPLWLYSVWVTGNALAGAIPRVSLAYTVAGVLLSVVVSLLLYGLGLGLILAALGGMYG